MTPLHIKRALFQFFVVNFALCQVSPMEINCPALKKGTQGDPLTLDCTFRSSGPLGEHMSVEWSYRPQGGGPLQSIFHYFSQSYPPTEGQFMGRVRWIGDLARGDASLQLLNASLSDNGTYTCAVRNPPADVHGSPGHVELTVFPRELSIRFTDVAVVMVLILIPSAVIVVVLLGRMCWPCGPQQVPAPPHHCHSPIEITEGEELACEYDRRKGWLCPCYMVLQDPACEEHYCYEEKNPKEVETQC